MEGLRRLGRWDVLVPVLLWLVGTVELATLRSTGWLPSVALEGLAAFCLVFRRTRPAVAVPCAAMALLAIPATGTQMEEAATPIFFYVLGIYSLGRYLSARGGLVTAAVTIALVVVDLWFDAGAADWTDVMFVLSLAVPPYVFGRVTRRLAEQSALLARQAEQLRDQAVRQERDRIARELHDVIAHSLSAMVVQTAAAQDALRTAPEEAGEILASVAETGRRALAETGRLLHLIRDDADELGLSPAPGLADVPRLVAELRASGLQVADRLDLPAAPPPDGVDVSAYRTAGDGRAAVEVVRRTLPDVVLMDIRMPVMDGIAATRELTAAGVPTKVLILTTYDLDRYVYDALGAGAAGFLLKATPPDRLVDGIRTVAAGEALLAPSLTRRLIEEYLRQPAPVDGVPGRLAALTEREREVLVLMARGHANDDIAAELVVAPATVKTHVNRVLGKLGVTNRVQAVVLAYETGLVRPGG